MKIHCPRCWKDYWPAAAWQHGDGKCEVLIKQESPVSLATSQSELKALAGMVLARSKGKVEVEPKLKVAFDRVAYQREYMKKRRAKKVDV